MIDEEYYEDQFVPPGAKIVSGFLENEESLQELNDRSGYSNFEISQHLDMYFRFFGAKDMDIVYLYFLSQKKQDEIMRILGKTQPAISYDVTRIKKQMQFVTVFVSFIDDFVFFICDNECKLTTDEKELLTVFFFSTSIVKTARILGKNHITCRTHLLNAVEKLKEYEYNDQYQFFKFMLNNLNKIKKQISENIEE